MKKLTVILFAVLISFLFSCNASKEKAYSGIKIEYDTLIVNIKGSIGQILKFNEKYYCIVERDNPFSSNPFRDFYILSSKGKVEYKAEISEKMNTGYYNDLFIRNDSIILKDYYDHLTFYFDTASYKWKEIKEADDLIYEDKDYSVFYLDFGEWGSTVWFKNKRTNKEYELESSFPKIHKIDSVYYLTKGRSIIKISNPEHLKLCNPNYYYEVVEKQEWSQGSSSRTGVEAIFQDTSSLHEAKLHIATSLVVNDTLFCICEDKNSTYIGYADGLKIKPAKIIGKDMSMFKRHNTYRGDQNKYRNQLIQFESKDRKRIGWLEINKNIIRVVDIVNTDKAKIIGKERANSIFEMLTDYHLKNFDKLPIKQLDSIVPYYGGYDVTPKHELLYEGDPCLRSYKIIEDTTITLLLEYYYKRSDNSPKIVTYEWRETRENSYNLYASDDEKFKTDEFQRRLDKIKLYLKAKFGNPIKPYSGNNYTSMEWKIENRMNIKLSWSHFDRYREISLEMYKE